MIVSISGVAQTWNTRKEIGCYDNFTFADQSNSAYCGFLGNVANIAFFTKNSCFSPIGCLGGARLVDEYIRQYLGNIPKLYNTYF
jgi:hypothetical protein